MPDALRLGRRLQALLGLTEQRCALCLAPAFPRSPETWLLCSSCWQYLQPYTGERCPGCGQPAPSGVSVPCGQCLAAPPPWDSLQFYGLYEGVLRELVLQFKFGGALSLAMLLGGLLARVYTLAPRTDMAVGIPLGWRRLRKRGYNQALELARWLAVAWRIPLRPDCLLRTRDLPPQETLSFAERQRTQRGSFCARHVHDQRILLVDDVMTTGATLRHAAYCLRAAGAREIHVVFMARTPSWEMPCPEKA